MTNEPAVLEAAEPFQAATEQFVDALPDGIRERGSAGVLLDARAAGAHTAHLHASDEALSLFERAGFRAEESWTLLFTP